MEIVINHLYPNELNLYGDSGNVLCLCNRLKWRGISVKVNKIGINDKLPPCDILFIGGGQDREMKLVGHDFLRKADSISYHIQNGGVTLAICGGYQLLGEYYKTRDSILKLSGILPFYTLCGNKRMIGNIVINTNFGTVVGFENHGGKTYLQSNLTPFGTVVRGYGNNGADLTEGVQYKNTYCTYLHGAVLPKNPHFADALLSLAAKTELPALNDDIENKCHNSILLKK